MKIISIVLSIVFSQVWATSALAGFFRVMAAGDYGSPWEQSNCSIVYQGDVAAGDLEKFKALAAAEGLTTTVTGIRNSPERALCLDAQGGDGREALALARYVFDEAIPTKIGPNGSCELECGIVFLGGRVSGEEFGWFSRTLNVTGKLSIRFSNIAPGEASLAYAELMDFAARPIDRSANRLVSVGSLNRILGSGTIGYRVNTLEDAVLFDIDLEGIGAISVTTEDQFVQLCENALNWKAGHTSYRRDWHNGEVEFDQRIRLTSTVVREAVGVELHDMDTSECLVQYNPEADYLWFCGVTGDLGLFLGDCGNGRPITVPTYYSIEPDEAIRALPRN